MIFLNVDLCLFCLAYRFVAKKIVCVHHSMIQHASASTCISLYYVYGALQHQILTGPDYYILWDH